METANSRLETIPFSAKWSFTYYTLWKLEQLQKINIRTGKTLLLVSCSFGESIQIVLGLLSTAAAGDNFF